MKSNSLYIILSFLVLSFLGCDKIDEPLVPRVTAPPQDTLAEKDSVIRKILLEDFTGHTCGNCPRAAETAQQLQEVYGKKVIVVGIHVGFFARVYTDGTGKYTTDFKTPAGDAYNQLWKNDATGLPNGFVNRSTVINNAIIVSHSAWGEAIEIMKDALPDVELAITVDYNSTNRSLSTEVKTIGLNELTGNYKLVLYLVEDNVVDYQKDYSLPSGNQDIPDYIHKHVLRDNINGTWGADLINGSLAVGSSVVKSYNYTLKDNWNDSECSIVAYIYNSDTYEIIQAEEVYIRK